MTRRRLYSAVLSIALLLSGCGHSSPVSTSGINTPPGSGCTAPTAASTMDEIVEVNVPSDFDPTSNPTPTTRVPFTVYMPKRCPGQSFPLILYGHGFGENRAKQGVLIDDGNPQPLLERGYVVIKFDERGHGDNRPSNGGGYARLLDPNAETQDARTILDWAYDHAAEISAQTEPNTGFAKDLKVGTLGGSYGGGFQLLLAALDPRIDAIAPDRTWHSLLYSLLPGDAVKAALRLLMLNIQLDTVPGQGVTATSALRTLASQLGPLAPTDMLVRTRADLVSALSAPTAQPRPVSEEEFESLLYTHGMEYFESQQAANKPWGFGEKQARLRAVPALFTQGQRDALFNMNEVYWNSRYFGATGADVRVVMHETSHENPLAGQVAGPWACGKYDAQAAILAWFDHYLKGIESDAFRTLPKVCISLLGSPGLAGAPVGVTLQSFPVGSLSGAGAVSVKLPTLSVTVPLGSGTNGVFVPITTVHGDDKVLAGIPRIGKITVMPGMGGLQTAIAIVGVGIRRAGQAFLVDEQVTSFVEGTHESNSGVQHTGEGVLLPGVGAQLQDGDELGLLFYEQHAQFAPVFTGPNASGLPVLISLTAGAPLPPLFSPLDPVLGLLAVPNPYQVTVTDVELPVLIPGHYPGSSLSQ